MTENCATCARCWNGDPSSSGTVGAPSPANEVKVVDVPHMGYTSDDKPNPRGELCVRGVNCFSVYYKGLQPRVQLCFLLKIWWDKDEKNTMETVDADGWVHTGDVAEIDSCGRIKIVDRVKVISFCPLTFHKPSLIYSTRIS
jgi:long-chain acyl-CoA synthetase